MGTIFIPFLTAPIMAIHCTRKRASPANDTIKQLVTILRHDFTNELVALLAASPVQSSICLKITAEIGIDPQVANQETGGNTYQSIYLVRYSSHSTLSSNPWVMSLI